MYSILSVDATESLGSLKIHSHHESAFAAAQALDDHIRQFAATNGQNKAEVKFQVEKWESLPDGTIFVVATDEFTLQVWRKYSKSGRLYGTTPKRTKLATFISVRLTQKEQEKPVAVKTTTPVKSVNIQAQLISELKEKLEQRRKNPPSIKARRVSQVQEEKINFDECFPAAAISPPRFVQTTSSRKFSIPDAPPAPPALPVFEWPTTAFDFPTTVFNINPLWQSAAVVNNNVNEEANEDVAVESSEWSTSSEDEEYYQRPAKRQQMDDEYVEDDEEDESVFTSEASDDDEYYRPPLAESIEVSQDWQWNDMLTPLLENGQNDDEHPYGAPAELDWLDSYQQIVNQWRAAHGLPTEYFL